MRSLLVITAVLFSISFSYAQDPVAGKVYDTQMLVESRVFEFVAESANPMRGRTIFLSPGYSLTVRPDSLLSYLPYYGRAYQASFDPGSAGIKFFSTDFDYIEKPRNKNGWNIKLRPRDVRHSPQLLISISENGKASLQVTSTDRESISFSGYIRKQPSL